MILRIRLNADTVLRVETIPEGLVELRIEEDGGDNVGTLITPAQADDLGDALHLAARSLVPSLRVNRPRGVL